MREKVGRDERYESVRNVVGLCVQGLREPGVSFLQSRRMSAVFVWFGLGGGGFFVEPKGVWGGFVHGCHGRG